MRGARMGCREGRRFLGERVSVFGLETLCETKS